VKWLIDAQLPMRLAERLRTLGHDALHTLDLPAANSTTDAEINRIASDENRIVVTKDSDFVDSFLVNSLPPRLLCVTTGNIRNTELLRLFETFLPDLERAFQQPCFVELSTTGLIVHP
jgi:predicted nuclease of predicted toxin-antitoxin system